MGCGVFYFLKSPKLGAELGLPLFEREGRTLRLTDLGKRAHQKAEDLLARHEAMLADLKGRHCARYAALSLRGCAEIGAARTRIARVAPNGGVVLCVCDGGGVREAACAGAAGVAGGAGTPDADEAAGSESGVLCVMINQ